MVNYTKKNYEYYLAKVFSWKTTIKNPHSSSHDYHLEITHLALLTLVGNEDIMMLSCCYKMGLSLKSQKKCDVEHFSFFVYVCGEKKFWHL